MTTKPESSLSNRFWTPAFAGVTNFEIFCGSIKINLHKVMRRVKKEHETGNVPYKDLYIYLFKGLVKETDEGNLGEAFIGNWVEDDSSFLFFTRPSDQVIEQLLMSRSDLELLDDYYFTYEQWQGGGLDVLRIGNFVIVPPWEETERKADEVRIRLDPGVVFGNGLHPTTRDCLKALAFARTQRFFSEVLDLGTGTGVLALAAAYLGADQVMAVDLNPLCVKTAFRNVRLNELEKVVFVMEGPAERFSDEPADLVIANIQYEVTRDLLDQRVFGNGDRLIISGLMRTQARDIRSHLARQHFKVVHEWDHEMTWFTLYCCKISEIVVSEKRSAPCEAKLLYLNKYL